MKAFWHRTRNVGDTLTPVLLKWLGVEFTNAEREDTGKLIGVGSILHSARANDIVWGSGFIKQCRAPAPEGLKVLAVRGPLSEKILGVNCGVYGDPGLLLPLLYHPRVGRRFSVGVIPHYAEAKHRVFRQLARRNGKVINVRQGWRSFVRELLACERVISSSLHGIVIAEAYGIPATWLQVTDAVIGNGFKFRDYYAGTGRTLKAGPIGNLGEIQNNLVRVIKDYVATRDQS